VIGRRRDVTPATKEVVDGAGAQSWFRTPGSAATVRTWAARSGTRASRPRPRRNVGSTVGCHRLLVLGSGAGRTRQHPSTRAVPPGNDDGHRCRAPARRRRWDLCPCPAGVLRSTMPV